ncbi:MAG: hypothetical protein HYU28_09395 [Actinobacteria bacterium]|nr:hypothetical protein [Actinomycetota bacterium]
MGNTTDDLAIRGFADAAMTAFSLHERFGFCHAAACLDGDGGLRDLTVFTDPDLHSVDAALAWAGCAVDGDDEVTQVVIFSAGSESVQEISDADLTAFRAMRAAFEPDGVHLVDWIRCDGRTSAPWPSPSARMLGALANPERGPGRRAEARASRRG